nr:hypothetical protein [Tanacetum cinerariifolium]
MVTYTEVSGPLEDLPENPPSPDYVPGLEHPPLLVYVPYVLEHAYPDFMPPEDDVLLAEEQPLPAVVLPTDILFYETMVTYTEVSGPLGDLSNVGSPGVVVYEHDGLPMHPPSSDYVPGPENPPSPDYVPGLEHPPLLAYVPYVLEPAYPDFMPPEDDVLLAEEQPLPTVVLPIDILFYEVTLSDLHFATT